MLILPPMVLKKDETFNCYLTAVVQPERLTWQRPSKLRLCYSKKLGLTQIIWVLRNLARRQLQISPAKLS